ncbi:F-box domain [Dillenia turbinata]|uniref:F-box domain n=1 Tax=Dillenia turbinata TaxID=194707 RepID=A0AAN8WC40_9MAGN
MKEEQHRRSLSSGEVIAENEDLLALILVRVPRKSLLHFKLVSKHWLSIISDPHFLLSHARKNPTPVSGLFLHRLTYPLFPQFDYIFLNPNQIPESIPFPSLKFPNFGSPFLRIVHSCNGLLCLQDKNNVDSFVFNPTTKQSFKLPVVSQDFILISTSLAFEPSSSFHYKAVCVWKDFSYINFSVFSSKTRRWNCVEKFKRLDGENDDIEGVFFKNGVYWNGSINWVGTEFYGFRLDIREQRLVHFVMPQLREGQNSRKVKYFGESNGHLHLVEICMPRSTLFDVFELERDYSRWVVKYRVDLSEMTFVHPGMVRIEFEECHPKHYAFRILCILRQGEETNATLVVAIPGKIISYNFIDEKFTTLRDLAPGRLDMPGLVRYKWSHSFQHIPTLPFV